MLGYLCRCGWRREEDGGVWVGGWVWGYTGEIQE